MTDKGNIKEGIQWLFENFSDEILDSFCEEDKIFNEYYIYFCEEIS